MRVLLLGSGGREHALGWKLAQSRHLELLVSAPGNPGLAGIGAVIPDVDITDPAAIVDLARANRIDLVVVGPEAPLAAGVVDALSDAGVTAFGPTAAAARLESSKAFAKEIMERAGIETARAAAFTEVGDAVAHLRSMPGPYVVKADGLAAGKGVLVTQDLLAAESWARLCFSGHFGPAGSRVVVEEHLDGSEVSVFAVCDGTSAVPLQPARDYKRLGDGDTGPNTGGMGCFSPVPDLDRNLVSSTVSDVVGPVLRVLAEDGVAYRGFLYVGLMLTDSGPKVLEFNCRLGDPETQVLMPRLDTDLLVLLAEAADGHLETPVQWHRKAAVGVVLAAAGYPDSPQRGAQVSGIDEAEALPGVHVFHAGTRLGPSGVEVNGGRVLNVVGTGSSLEAARHVAYDAVDLVRFEGRQHRTDIASGTGG